MEVGNKKGLQVPEYFGKILREVLMRKDRLVILMLTGVLLLVIALPTSNQTEETEKESAQGESSAEETAVQTAGSSYTQSLEERLAEVLSGVEGVGKVQVMITLRSTSEKVVEKDVTSQKESLQEEDSQGGSRTTQNTEESQTTVYGGGETVGSGEPYVTKELSPAIEGVVVIAQGGGDPVTVQDITEAVQALFDIDTHKIKVMKSN